MAHNSAHYSLVNVGSGFMQCFDVFTACEIFLCYAAHRRSGPRATKSYWSIKALDKLKRLPPTCCETTHADDVRSVLPVTTDTLPAKFD